MYAQVVVLTYQSPTVDSYSYSIPKNLKVIVGQLIEVPFGKRNPQGIIIDIHNKKPNVKTKPISKILFSQPILLPYQIKLLHWMNKFYMAPLVNCLDAMLPKIPHRSLMVNGSSQITMNDERLTLPQSLILVPTINHIPETLAKFPKAKNHIVYHNEMKMSTRFSAWLKILSGDSDYIFGSRATIFAPFSNLKEIIIYDEHDGAYKDQRSPYFDTLTIAQIICSLTGAKIKIVDPSPKITTYFFLKNNIKMQKFPLKTKIVSLKDERSSGNFSPISSFVQTQLSKNQNILLFMNKKKESGQLYCKNCKFHDFFEKQIEKCLKCSSVDIYFNILNTDSLKKEVAQISKNPNIEIHSSSIFYSPIIKKYDLAVYVLPDSLLNRTDFSAVETLFSQIVNLKKLLNKNGSLIVQTFSPDDSTLVSTINGNYDSYFKTQLENRHLLAYPPFALLVKLTTKGKNRAKTEKSSHELFRTLNSAIQPASPAKRGEQFNYLAIDLLGPYESIFFSSQPTFNIIIKYKLGSYTTLEDKFKAIKNDR